jgi:hypothetical protein
LAAAKLEGTRNSFMKIRDLKKLKEIIEIGLITSVFPNLRLNGVQHNGVTLLP